MQHMALVWGGGGGGVCVLFFFAFFLIHHKKAFIHDADSAEHEILNCFYEFPGQIQSMAKTSCNKNVHLSQCTVQSC